MKTVKNIINFFVFICLFSVLFIFVTDNKNLMILNLFPLKMGISIPVYLGAITHSIYIKAIYLKQKWRK